MHGSHISHEPICHDSWVLYTRYLNRHVHKYFKGSGFAHVMEDKVEKRQGRLLTEVMSQNTLRCRCYLAVGKEQVPCGK